jgi:hypothetical protein
MRDMAAPSHALDEALMEIWRQALVERSKAVNLGGEIFPVRKTASGRLLEVDFTHEGKSYRGIEQNPNTKSRWAQLANKGAKVMQFLEAGKYIAVVVDGKTTLYSSKKA